MQMDESSGFPSYREQWLILASGNLARSAPEALVVLTLSRRAGAEELPSLSRPIQAPDRNTAGGISPVREHPKRIVRRTHGQWSI